MPRYVKKKNMSCEVCKKKLLARTAQRRHHQTFHPEYVDKAAVKRMESAKKPSNCRRRSRRREVIASNINAQNAVREKIQEGIEIGLKVRAVEGKGDGVLSRRTFLKGEFICEYAGELVSAEIARDREIEYAEKGKGCYMFYFKFQDKKMCVDATEDNGRMGRFFNHSKRTYNVSPQLFVIEGYPRIVFYAARRIHPQEELVYDYRDRSKESLKGNSWLAQ